MSLNYSIAMMGNPLKKEEPKKAYAKAQTNGELNLKELSTLIASKCTVHQADVSAVLIATTECMLEGLKAGKQVDFGDLGKFRLQILNEGAESLEKFTSTNITGVSIQYIPGEDLKNVFAGLEFQPVATRKAQQAVLRAETAGETTVDISKKPAAGGGDSESPDEI
jgi:predicted histone-like DNA-binding protein